MKHLTNGFTLVEIMICGVVIIAVTFITILAFKGNLADSSAFAILCPDESRAISQQQMIKQQAILIQQQNELIKLKKEGK
jgi:Tfp pilus assembly protein PilE